MLVCQLTMRTIEAGEPNTYNARHTVWLEKNGQWRTLFQPNYQGSRTGQDGSCNVIGRANFS